ncbi:MAG: outer membrane lipoprotein carrier protein LolA [Deltaproteobacteria bacterium]|nr:outer membrane lipoprotein carrier protein LolA [Deltaproteobacteria bacterium]
MTSMPARYLRKPVVVMAGMLLFFLPSPALSVEKSGQAMADAPPGQGRRLNDKEIEEAFEKIKTLQAGLDSASANIRQTKTNPILKKPLISEGTVLLKKPNLLRMEMKRPEHTITIVDGRVMWVFRPDTKEALKYVLSEQLMANQAVKFFSSAMNISLEELGKKFKVEMFEDAGVWVLDLTPKSGMAAKFLSKIRIYFKDGAPLPFKHEVIGKKGNLTVMEFSDTALNPATAPDAFTFTLPKDARITNTFDEEAPR